MVDVMSLRFRVIGISISVNFVVNMKVSGSRCYCWFLIVIVR